MISLVEERLYQDFLLYTDGHISDISIIAIIVFSLLDSELALPKLSCKCLACRYCFTQCSLNGMFCVPLLWLRAY